MVLGDERRKHLATLVHIVVAVVIVLGLNIGALLLYRHYTRKNVKKQLSMHVNSAVS